MSIIYRGEKTKYDQVGEIDDQGRVYKGKAWDAHLLGWVKESQVQRGSEFAPEIVGWIDDEGQVLRGDRFAPEPVGWVTDDGKVHRGDRFVPELVGETDPPSRSGGAALLLLLDEETSSSGLLSGVGQAVAAAAVTEGIRWWKRSRQREDPRDKVTESPAEAEEDPDSLEALERHRAAWGPPKEAAFANTPGDVVAEAAVTAGMAVWEYLDEERNPPSPVDLERLMRPHWDISHVSCLVLGGSKEKLERYVGQMYRPQVILYSADPDTVSALGLEVIDAPHEVTPALVGYPHIDQASTVADAVRSLGCGVMSLAHSAEWDQTPTPQIANAMLRISSWSNRGLPPVAIVRGPTDFIAYYAPNLKASAVVCISSESDLEQAGISVAANIEAVQMAIERKVGPEGRKRSQALQAFQLPIPPSLSGPFKVELKEKGPSASMVVLAIKEYVGGDTLRAYKLTHDAPSDVLVGINQFLAEAIADKLRAAGAEVEVASLDGGS